jgi:antitoxin component of MazEF toxin-antitoxin module
MTNQAIPCKLHKHGNSLCIVLRRDVREQIPWRRDDVLAVRVAGEKLIIERIPLERMAILRTGEVQVRNESLFQE